MRKFILRALGAMILLGAVRAATVAIAPLNNAYMRFLQVPEALAPTISGTILAVGYLFAVFGPLLGGRLADRWGAARTFVASAVIFAAVYFLWSRVQGHQMLYVYRAILALCTGALYIGVQAYLLEGAPAGKKGMAMGFYGLGFGLGSAIGPTVAARLITPDDVARPFAVLAVACLVGTLFSLLIVLIQGRSQRAAEDRERAAHGTAGTGQAGAESGVKGLAALRGLNYPSLLVFGMGIFYGVAQLAVLTNIDDLGVYAYGLKPGTAMMGLVIYSLISLLQPLGGMLGDKLGQARMVFLGMLLVALGFGPLAFLPEPSLIYPCMAAAGLGAMLFTPNSMALLGRYADPEIKATVLGIFQSVTSLGSAVGVLVAGMLYSANTVRAPFMLVTVSMILAAAMALAAWLAELRITKASAATAKAG